MRRTVIALAILLAGQVILAVVLQLGGPATRAPAPERPLAAFEREGIDAVRISAGGGDALRIERGDEGWRLPAADGFPAGTQYVDRLLRRMGGFDNPLPVARSEAARERFRVGADAYERRVELLAGGEPRATVFFGESAGTERVYARAAGRDMIHEVDFALWQASADPTKWYDKSVAMVEPAAVAQAEMPGFVVRRADSGDGWRLLADGGDVEPAKAGATQTLVRRLARPDIRGVARAAPPQGSPTLAYTLTTKDGSEIRFRYFAGGEGGKPRLYRSDQPWRYTVAADHLARLQEADTKRLAAGTGGGEAGASAGAKTKRAGAAS